MNTKNNTGLVPVETVLTWEEIQEKFDTAFAEAEEQFLRPPSKVKKMTPEAEFIFNALYENWEHSCDQEAGNYGNRRYYWHGNKHRFIEHYNEDVCAGKDYLFDYFKEDFGLVDVEDSDK